MLPQVQASWTGQAATALTAESEALARHASAAAVHFTTAGAALRELAERCDSAVEVEVPRLNRAWEDAHDRHARAVALRRAQESAHAAALADLLPLAVHGQSGSAAPPRRQLPSITAPSVEESDAALAAARARLEDQFDDLREQLRAETRRAGHELAAATVVPVPDALARAYAGGGWASTLLGWVGAGPGVHALQGDLPLTSLRLATSGPLPPDSATLGTMLEDARRLGLDPPQYAQVLQAYWQARAFEAAGIDPADWDPSRGASHNRETIIAVYEYYGRLYRENPELEWAGLANLVGPGFAASFFDLGGFRDLAAHVADLPDVPGAVLVPMRELAGASDAELAFYETTFLTMQKAIFTDMGAGHEAYLDGGLASLREMRAAGLIDDATMRTWETVQRGKDTGDPELLHAGAYGLALREQFDIIGDSWDSMRDRRPLGEAVTYLFTAVGRPSLPGTRFPGEVSPLAVPVTPERIPLPDPADLPYVPGIPFVDLPDAVEPPQVTVRTSLPDFNVADREARWEYFTADTLPRYVDLLEGGQVAELTAADMEQRIAAERTLRRLPEVVAQHDPRDWRTVVE